MKRFLLPLLMVFTIAALLMAAVPANASFVLVLDDPTINGSVNPNSMSGADVIIIDNQAAGTLSSGPPVQLTSTTGDGTATAGVVNFNGALPGGSVWTVNVTTGISKPVIGPNRLDLNSVNVSSTGAGILDIYVTDTDFILPSGGPYVMTDSIGGTTDGTVSAQGLMCAWNWEFHNDYTTSLMTFNTSPFSGSATGTFFNGGPSNAFSLTKWVRIEHTARGQITSFDNELTVPEPGTMLLIGTGLLGLAGLGRKKLLKK